jgi:hypothetical protein
MSQNILEGAQCSLLLSKLHFGGERYDRHGAASAGGERAKYRWIPCKLVAAIHQQFPAHAKSFRPRPAVRNGAWLVMP